MTRQRVHRGVIRRNEMISRNRSETSKEEMKEETEEQEQPIQLTGNLSVQRSQGVQKLETSKKGREEWVGGQELHFF